MLYASQSNSACSVKKTTKVVLLPPQSGNQEMDSDVENVPNELPNQEDEFELFEPAGAMEIEDEVEESDDDKEEEVILPKDGNICMDIRIPNGNKRQRSSKSFHQSPWRILLTIINIFSASLSLIYGNYTSLMTC